MSPSGAILPPGELNMYMYPTVTFEGTTLPTQLKAAELECLEWMLKTCAAKPQRMFHRRGDGRGREGSGGAGRGRRGGWWRLGEEGHEPDAREGAEGRV